MSYLDYEIHHNGHIYRVNKELVTLSSRLLRNNIDQSPKYLELQADVSSVNFETFLNAIQGKDFEVTIDNIDDLKMLAEGFQVKKLLSILEIEEQEIRSPENILSKAIDLARQNQPIDKFIPIIARNISKLVKVPQLSLLPLDAIDQIFSHEECCPRDQASVIKFFEALLTLKQQKKENPSFLFKHINFTQLGFEDIEHILSIPNLRKSDVIDQITETAIKLIEIISAEAADNEEKINNQKNETREMEEKIRAINNQRESIQKHHARAKKRLDDAVEQVKQNRSYMIDVEKRLNTVRGAAIPPQVQPSTEKKRKRPNRFVEWCDNGFPEEGPTPKPAPRPANLKRKMSASITQRTIGPMHAIKPIRSNSNPVQTQQTQAPTVSIKVEKPQIKLSQYSSPPAAPAPAPAKNMPAIKIERAQRENVSIGGIKIEKADKSGFKLEK